MLSVILPTYNEGGNIVPLIRVLEGQLKRVSFEILVVDDNSPDGTAKIVKKYFRKKSKVKVFIRKSDPGLAHAIYFGLLQTKSDWVAVMDTDFNHHPKDLITLLTKKNASDIVVGSRYVRGGGMEDKLRYVLSYLYNMLLRNILGLPTNDSLSGFFVARRQKLLLLPLEKIFLGYGDYFIRLLYYARRHSFTIKEIPVYYENRHWGESKSRFIPMFLSYTKTALDLLFNS